MGEAKVLGIQPMHTGKLFAHGCEPAGQVVRVVKVCRKALRMQAA